MAKKIFEIEIIQFALTDPVVVQINWFHVIFNI